MAQRICVTGASGQAGQVLGFEPARSWRDHVPG